MKDLTYIIMQEDYGPLRTKQIIELHVKRRVKLSS